MNTKIKDGGNLFHKSGELFPYDPDVPRFVTQTLRKNWIKARMFMKTRTLLKGMVYHRGPNVLRSIVRAG